MKDNISFNNGKKGMDRDTHPSMLGEQNYSFAMNATYDDTGVGDGALMLQNEPSNLRCITFKDGFKVIGIANDISENRTILLLVNPETNVSMIGALYNIVIEQNDADTKVYSCDCNEKILLNKPLEEVVQEDTCKFDIWVTDEGCDGIAPEYKKCLNFSINHPVKHGNIIIKNEKCGKTLYWTDFYNPPRYLVISRLEEYKYSQKGVCGEDPKLICPDDGDGYLKGINCDMLRIFPIYSKPCLKPVEVQYGGRLKTGVYEFLLAYCDRGGNEMTQYFSITNPITIFDKDKNYLNRDNVWERTDLGIKLKVDRLDAKVDYYKVAVIQRTAQDGVTSYFVEGVHPTSDNIITYHSEEDKERITITKLLQAKQVYTLSEMITASNGYVFHGGLVVEKEMNLQPVVNLMGAFLKWKTVKATEDLYDVPVNTSLYKSYMRDEVYPFSIRFISTNGFETSNYILVNRPKTSFDSEKISSSNKDLKSISKFVPSCSENSRTERWQIYNTATKDSESESSLTTEEKSLLNTEVNLQCNPTPHSTGKFGYYESTEKYPDNSDLYDSSKLRISKELLDRLPNNVKSDFREFVKVTDKGSYFETTSECDLTCKPIRHYRFPDFNISPFIDTDSGTSPFSKAIIYPIGVYLDPEIVNFFLDVAVDNGLITREQRGRLAQYEIFRGDRTLDKSIIAKGLGYDMLVDEDNEEQLYSNYPYNDLHDDVVLYKDKGRTTPIKHPYNSTGNNKFTFHSPDTHFRKPNIPSEAKVEAYMIGESRGRFVSVDDHSKWVILTNKAFKYATSLAWGEALLEMGVRIGDFLMKDAIASDRIKTGYYWGEASSKGTINDSEFSLDHGITSVGKDIVSGNNGSLKQTKAAKTDNTVNLGEKPVVDENNALIDKVNPFNDGNPKFVKEGTGVGYQEINHNTGRINNLTKVAILTMMLSDVASQVSRYKQEWVNIFRNNGHPENFAYYYASEGWYNRAMANPKEGDMLRAVASDAYLKPGRFRISDVNEEGVIRINNVDRESSVYLSFGGRDFNITYPTDYINIDDSRQTSSTAALSGGGGNIGESVDTTDGGVEGMKNATNWTYDTRSPEIQQGIASPYMSLKQYRPDQYGKVESIKWIPTGLCGYLDDTSKSYTVFGGDTFITRFSLKRKMPIFLSNQVGITDRVPFRYYPHRNVGHPVYYADYDIAELRGIKNRGDGGLFDTIVSAFTVKGFPVAYPMSYYNFDNKTEGSGGEKALYIVPPSKFYLSYYGIPQFLVESEINCNTRYAYTDMERNFFPNISDYVEWTQEKNVPLHVDNVFLYNGTFSKDTTMVGARVLPPTFDASMYNCLYDSPNGVAYSRQDVSEQDLTDPWLVYKPLDFYQFQTSYGKLKDLRGIESTQILGRFEHQIVLFNAIDVLKDRLTPQTQELGTGGIFASRPMEYAKADLGYAGTQHKTMVSCELGHFWVDARRGHVFHIPPNGKGLSEITVGLRDWFKRHLPFKILKGGIYKLTADGKKIPLEDTEVDNNFKGLGIAMVWDSRLKRLLITKKDYLVRDEYKGRIEYRDGSFYLEGTTEYTYKNEIPVSNTAVFENVSFTVGYSPLTESWVSYYSYTPDYYIGHQNYFQSGINYSADKSEEGVWTHLLHSNSYQVFYGKRYPFTIELPIKNDYTNKLLGGVHYWMDSKRNQGDGNFSENRKIGFNRVWIYNNSQNSGALDLILSERNNLSQKIKYPKLVSDPIKGISTEVLATEENKHWKFNFFYNRVRDELNNQPIWLNDKNQIDKRINPKSVQYNQKWLDRLRGDWFLVRLTQDVESRYKLIFKWLTSKEKLF